MPPGFSPGEVGADRPSAVRPSVQIFSLPVGSFRQDTTVVGRTEDRSWWKTSREPAGFARDPPVRACVHPLERRPASLPEAGCGKAQEGRVREAGLAPCGDRSGEALKPMRASARPGRGLWRVRISVVSKALKLRGIVNSWSSEQEHAMPETAGGQRRRKAYGSTGGKRSEG
jgi:hypothetical protein